MQRNRFSTTGLNFPRAAPSGRSKWSLGLALCAVLATLAGCVTKVDEARTAYADGEGSVEEAERLYQEAMKDPGWEELAAEELYDLYMLEGQKTAKAGKYKAAETYYRKALEVRPKDDLATGGLAEALQKMMRYDEALEVARAGIGTGCAGCRRITAVLLIQRADQQLQQGQWAQAEQDYVEVSQLLPDASVAMGIVRARYGRKDIQGAAKGLRQAVALIGAQDVQARKQYLELRRAVVMLALQADEVELADELLDLAPEGAPAEAQLGLAMEIAMEFRNQGKPDEALDRMTALVDAAAQGKLRVTEDQIVQLRDRVASIHAARASQRLAEGDRAGAQTDLDRALELKPNHPPFELQRVLVVAGQGDLAAAREKLEGIGSETKGHDEVAAILSALEVDRLVLAGQLDAARTELEQARKRAADLPEVHIAAAQVLARTPLSELSKAEQAEVRKVGLVSYPQNRITRVAEALSELDWSRQQIRGLGTTYPYRAPDTTRRIDALEKELKAFYPYPVKFQGDPRAVLVLRNTGADAMNVEFDGGGVASPAQIAPGETAKVVVPEPGLVKLSYRGTTAALVAEPYTEVEVAL